MNDLKEVSLEIQFEREMVALSRNHPDHFLEKLLSIYLSQLLTAVRTALYSKNPEGFQQPSHRCYLCFPLINDSVCLQGRSLFLMGKMYCVSHFPESHDKSIMTC